MASQISGKATVCSDQQQCKHHLPFMKGNHHWPVDSNAESVSQSWRHHYRRYTVKPSRLLSSANHRDVDTPRVQTLSEYSDTTSSDWFLLIEVSKVITWRDRRGIWPWEVTYSTLYVLNLSKHDDVIKWEHFLRYWLFVWGIHRSPVNSPHKGQWRGALMMSLILHEPTVEQTMETPVIWDAIALIMTSL